MILKQASCLPLFRPLGQVSSCARLAMTKSPLSRTLSSSLSAARPYPSPNCLNIHAELRRVAWVRGSNKVTPYSNVSSVMRFCLMKQSPNKLTNLQHFSPHMRTHAGAYARMMMLVCKIVRLLKYKAYCLTQALHSVRLLKIKDFAFLHAPGGIFGGVYG